MAIGNMVRQAPRVALGALFLVGGVSGLIGVLIGHEPFVPPASEAADAFTHALMAFVPFWAFMKMVQLIGGLALLSPRHAPLGALIVAPVASVIILLQLLLNAPAGLPIGVIVAVLEAWCLWSWRGHYRRLIDGKAARARSIA